LRAPIWIREGLLAALDRAWPGDDGDVPSADRRIRAREADHRVLFLHVAAYQLVGFGDLDDLRHAGHLGQRILLHRPLVSSNADGGPLRSRHRMRPIAQPFDPIADRLHLFDRRVRLHHYQHEWLSPGIYKCTGGCICGK
jgi:hypothetical protein